METAVNDACKLVTFIITADWSPLSLAENLAGVLFRIPTSFSLFSDRNSYPAALDLETGTGLSLSPVVARSGWYEIAIDSRLRV